MRLFQKTKDGGPESPVDAYFLFEFKSFLSIAILKFNKGGREAYHSHAFDAFTWLIKGELIEEFPNGHAKRYRRTFRPKSTARARVHRVRAYTDGWCVTIRGPWRDTWTEYNDNTGRTTTLTHGRKVYDKV